MKAIMLRVFQTKTFNFHHLLIELSLKMSPDVLEDPPQIQYPFPSLIRTLPAAPARLKKIRLI